MNGMASKLGRCCWSDWQSKDGVLRCVGSRQ